MIGREVPFCVVGTSPEYRFCGFSSHVWAQACEIVGTVLINDFEGAEPAPGLMRILLDYRSTLSMTRSV